MSKTPESIKHEIRRHQAFRDIMRQFDYYDELIKPQIDMYQTWNFLNNRRLKRECLIKNNKGIFIYNQFIKRDDRVVIYGFGRFGAWKLKDYLGNDFTIVAFADRDAYSKETIRGIRVICINEIKSIVFDKIIIAVLDQVGHDEAYMTLRNFGVEDEKIVRMPTFKEVVDNLESYIELMRGIDE